jgi:hypothetical protein
MLLGSETCFFAGLGKLKLSEFRGVGGSRSWLFAMTSNLLEGCKKALTKALGLKYEMREGKYWSVVPFSLQGTITDSRQDSAGLGTCPAKLNCTRGNIA